MRQQFLETKISYLETNTLNTWQPVFLCTKGISCCETEQHLEWRTILTNDMNSIRSYQTNWTTFICIKKQWENWDTEDLTRRTLNHSYFEICRRTSEARFRSTMQTCGQGGEVLPYIDIDYSGMCRCTGYDFQAFLWRTGFRKRDIIGQEQGAKLKRV